MLNSLKNLSVTLLAILQTRLALLGNELQVQKILLVQLLGLLLALVFCAGLAVLLGLGLVVSVWWEHRVLVLGMSVLVFSTAALACYLRLQRLLNPVDAVFGASLAALAEDVALLRAVAQTNLTASNPKPPGSVRE